MNNIIKKRKNDSWEKFLYKCLNLDPMRSYLDGLDYCILRMTCKSFKSLRKTQNQVKLVRTRDRALQLCHGFLEIYLGKRKFPSITHIYHYENTPVGITVDINELRSNDLFDCRQYDRSSSLKNCIIATGDIRAIKFLKEKEIIFPPEIVSTSSKKGNLNVLSWLWNLRGTECSNREYGALALFLSSKSGFIHIVKWIIEDQKLFEKDGPQRFTNCLRDSICCALQSKHLDIANYLSQYCTIEKSFFNDRAITNSGMFEWINQNCE